MTDHSEVIEAFSKIYRNDEWTHGSGPGSLYENTIEYRAFVSRFIKENAVASVTDLGCGDWQFSRYLDWTGIQYLGLDVVEAVVTENRRHYLAPTIDFQVCTGPSSLPGGDLLLCKDVLQHLPNSTIAEYLAVITERYKFALITNAIEPLAACNEDIPPGGGRPVRLEAAPFSKKGAVVFTHYPQAGSHLWKKGTFLIV